MPSVLFICTGNLCRSPLAEAYFKEVLKRNGKTSHWIVNSAGTWTKDGIPPLQFCQQLGKEVGLDIGKHLTRSVTSTPIRKYDVIVVMEKGHREALVSEYPDLQKRIHLLTQLAGLYAYDIHDPILIRNETGLEIIRDMMECLDLAFEKICQLAEDMHRPLL